MVSAVNIFNDKTQYMYPFNLWVYVTIPIIHLQCIHISSFCVIVWYFCCLNFILTLKTHFGGAFGKAIISITMETLHIFTLIAWYCHLKITDLKVCSFSEHSWYRSSNLRSPESSYFYVYFHASSPCKQKIQEPLSVTPKQNVTGFHDCSSLSMLATSACDLNISNPSINMRDPESDSQYECCQNKN